MKKILIGLLALGNLSAFAQNKVRIGCENSKLTISFSVYDGFFDKEGYKDSANMRVNRSRVDSFRVAKKSMTLIVNELDSQYIFKLPKKSIEEGAEKFEIKVSYTSVNQWTPFKYTETCYLKN